MEGTTRRAVAALVLTLAAAVSCAPVEGDLGALLSVEARASLPPPRNGELIPPQDSSFDKALKQYLKDTGKRALEEDPRREPVVRGVEGGAKAAAVVPAAKTVEGGAKAMVAPAVKDTEGGAKAPDSPVVKAVEGGAKAPDSPVVKGAEGGAKAPGPSVLNATGGVGMMQAKGDARDNSGSKFPFGGIFYINLDSRTDRRQSMEDQLKLITTTYERFPAVKLTSATVPTEQSSDLFNRYMKNKKTAASYDTLSPQAKTFVSSVFLSHLAVMEKIMHDHTTSNNSNPDTMYLILEDDAKLNPGWAEQFNDVMGQIPDDWDIVRLGTWGATRPEDKLTERVTRATRPFKANNLIYYAGMHAVVVRPKTLPNVIKLLKHEPLIDIDEMISVCCGDLKSYVVSDPPIVGATGAASDHPSFHAR